MKAARTVTLRQKGGWMNHRWRTASRIGLLALTVFVTRLPFLEPGYGNDPDAWRMANAARHIASTGSYQASRLPGYPLLEGVYALLWSWGGSAIAFNAATAAMSALGSATFAIYLHRLKSRDFLWGGAALASTPVFYIHSTGSMDYVWSLTFILLASYLATASRPRAGGICLGLAIACRLTAGAMLIPLCLMMASQSGLSLRKFLLLALPAAVVGTLAYLPVISIYGLSAFQFVDGTPDPLEVMYLVSVGVWGAIGSIAVCLVVVVLLVRSRSQASPSVYANRLLGISWAVAVLLYVVAFLRLPLEAGYLLPAVPFAILLLGRWATSRLFRLLCLALVLSPFLLSIERTAVHWTGPIFRDHMQRAEAVALIERAIRAGDAVTTETVLVTGWYLPMIETELGSDSKGLARYIGLLSSADLGRYRDSGYDVYYLPPIREYNLQVHGIDLDAAGVPALDVSDEG